MVRSIIMLGIFWYAYLAYLFIDMQMHPIFLILLTLILGIFIKAIQPLKKYILMNRKEGERL